MSLPEVHFHLNVGDRQAYVCRLLRKAHLKGSKVLVRLDGAALESLDSALWLMGQHDFVPHARATDPAHVQRHSPILLSNGVSATFEADVLVNLGSDVPPTAGTAKRLIEVVGDVAIDKQQARERWKRYKADGFDPQAHDLAKG